MREGKAVNSELQGFVVCVDQTVVLHDFSESTQGPKKVSDVT